MIFSFEYMWKDTVLAIVSIDDMEVVSVVNYTDNIIDRPFGNCSNPTMENVNELFSERCFPRSRANRKQILSNKSYGYDPACIVRDTHGVMVDDCYWLRFNGEKLSWDDVKKWKYHNM